LAAGRDRNRPDQNTAGNDAFGGVNRRTDCASRLTSVCDADQDQADNKSE
jgi:hypothetical protein